MKRLAILIFTAITGSNCCGAALPTDQAPTVTRGSFTVYNYSGQSVAVSIYDGRNDAGEEINEQFLDIPFAYQQEITFNLPIGQYLLQINQITAGGQVLPFDYEEPVGTDVTVPGTFTIHVDTIAPSSPSESENSDPELSDSDTENT